jgi:succinoglycan biosynthesis protein ExoM
MSIPSLVFKHEIMNDLPTIDICVATYKRPFLLRQLLQSLLLQETESKFVYSIILIDNDKEGSAEPVINSYRNCGVKIEYDIEPVQNISLARNRGVNMANGPYIAIVDDDQQADPYWLLNLFQAINEHQAVAVIAQVISIFPTDDVPGHIRNSRHFVLPTPDSGATEGFVYGTGGCLLKRDIIHGDLVPFDPDFGRTGGGDSVFFARKKRQNNKIIYCREAIVRENIPPNRAKASWLLRRFFRNGHVSYLMLKLEQNASSSNVLKSKRKSYLIQLAKAVIKLLLLQLQQLFGRTDKSTEHAETLQNIAFYSGFLLSFFGIHYQYYK